METSHKNRWITALVALPLLIVLILKGGAFLFSLLLFGVSCIGFYEWQKITDIKHYSLESAKNVPYLLIPVLYFFSFYPPSFHILAAMLSAGVILFMLLKGFDGTESHFKGSIYILTGFLYSSFFLSFASRIMIEAGPKGIFFLLISVFASDTGAFYAGRKFGKNKLMENVSPKKTIEGFTGGFILSVFAAIFCKIIFFEELSFFTAFLCGVAAGALVPLGDLFESMTKRVFNVKDSGNILPGHGGILDRIDGLLFAVPVFYILYTF
ncbi:MAG: phosphatidate cytidylyltransferase [Desulfobacteraceae bacterium]|nr:phosphatidate cytidylyltransferase [Desulfobacteraceae bacterium]